MTDPAEGLDVITRYELALLARLQQFELTDEALAEATGLPLNRLVDRSAHVPTEFDTELISTIAEYLINEEELGDDFDTDDERERVVGIGMFIYGWTKWDP